MENDSALSSMTDIIERLQYFKPHELLGPGALHLWNAHKILCCSADWLVKIETFRAKLDKRLVCNFGEHRLRGIRIPDEFLRLRALGQYYTYHLWCAGDFHSPELPLLNLYEEACAFGFGGVKADIKHGYVHIDDRHGPAWRVVIS